LHIPTYTYTATCVHTNYLLRVFLESVFWCAFELVSTSNIGASLGDVRSDVGIYIWIVEVEKLCPLGGVLGGGCPLSQSFDEVFTPVAMVDVLSMINTQYVQYEV
jgi:hypothetical protein